MKKYSIYFIALLICSCQKKESFIEKISITPKVEIDSFGDDIFFTQIDLKTDEEHVYLVDSRQGILVKANKDLEYISSFQLQGPGEDEVEYPQTLSILDDLIYLEDVGGNKVSVFNKSDMSFRKMHKLPFRTLGVGLLIGNSEEILFSTFPDQVNSGGILFNPETGETKHFGFHFTQDRINPIQQFSILRADGASIEKPFQISRSLGQIYELSKDGEKVKNFDLSSFEPIKRGLDSMFADRQKKPELLNSVQDLIITAQVIGKKVLLGITDRIGTDRTNVRHLLLMDLSSDQPKLEKIISLKTGNDDEKFHFRAVYFDQYSSNLYAQGLITGNLYAFDLTL